MCMVVLVVVKLAVKCEKDFAIIVTFVNQRGVRCASLWNVVTSSILKRRSAYYYMATFKKIDSIFRLHFEGGGEE